MLAGALVGAVLVIHVQIVYPFVIALVASVVLATHALAAPRPAWATSGRG